MTQEIEALSRTGAIKGGLTSSVEDEGDNEFMAFCFGYPNPNA
jgi:hypothetical protein